MNTRAIAGIAITLGVLAVGATHAAAQTPGPTPAGLTVAVTGSDSTDCGTAASP